MVAPRLMSLLGLLVLLGISWALSEDRRRISWRVVLWGLGLQVAIGLLLLPTVVQRYVLGPLVSGMVWIATFGHVRIQVEPDKVFFRAMEWVVAILTESTLEGASFVFGSLADDTDIGATVAFQVLPVIIFVSAVAAVLYHLRVIQALVRAMAWLMQRSLGTSGAETFGAALLITLGIESVTAIREYLREMTRSEICTIITTFMATIAGSVMVVYATFGVAPGHLLTASLMSAPAAIVVSKILVPERETPKTGKRHAISVPVETHNVVDAAAVGAIDGMKLVLHVGAMLIAFLGLVHLFNEALALVSQPLLAYVYSPLTSGSSWPVLDVITLRDIFGVVFMPFAWLLGVPSADVVSVAQLLGTKSVLNEFLAYLELQHMEASLTPRGFMVATYALCGFANPGSVGIAIAALSGLLPERRPLIVTMTLKAYIGGTLACFMTACVAGILIYA